MSESYTQDKREEPPPVYETRATTVRCCFHPEPPPSKCRQTRNKLAQTTDRSLPYNPRLPSSYAIKICNSAVNIPNISLSKFPTAASSNLLNYQNFQLPRHSTHDAHIRMQKTKLIDATPGRIPPPTPALLNVKIALFPFCLVIFAPSGCNTEKHAAAGQVETADARG